MNSHSLNERKSLLAGMWFNPAPGLCACVQSRGCAGSFQPCARCTLLLAAAAAAEHCVFLPDVHVAPLAFPMGRLGAGFKPPGGFAPSVRLFSPTHISKQQFSCVRCMVLHAEPSPVPWASVRLAPCNDGQVEVWGDGLPRVMHAEKSSPGCSLGHVSHIPIPLMPSHWMLLVAPPGSDAALLCAGHPGATECLSGAGGHCAAHPKAGPKQVSNTSCLFTCCWGSLTHAAPSPSATAAPDEYFPFSYITLIALLWENCSRPALGCHAPTECPEMRMVGTRHAKEHSVPWLCP